MVGGTTWSRIESTLKTASTAPAAPSRWPTAPFVEDIDGPFVPIAEKTLNRPELDLVAKRRRSAVPH